MNSMYRRLNLDNVQIELEECIKIFRRETPKHIKDGWESIHTLESILDAVRLARNIETLNGG